jgi:hypothetical protein
MKNTTLKLTTITILAAAIFGVTAIARAAGADTAAPAAKGKSSGDKFYGPITAVDTNAMSFTVSDQVYTVNSKTEITLAKDGSKAALADAAVGEPARGSYTKGSDGKLVVTKVRFGKKTSATGAGGKTGGKSGGKKKKDTGAADAAATPDASKN